MIPYDEMMERSLPRYLRDDIDALLKGIEDHSTLWDCLYNEVQGSINLAFYGHEISQEQADYLRKKYLGMED